jgi:hypothetical protein
MFNCDNCLQTIDPARVESLVFDHRIFIVCEVCHERLANVVGPILRLRQMEPALRE